MVNIQELDNFTKKTRRREYDDGLMDFLFGVATLSLCLINWFFMSPVGIKWYMNSLIKNREITIIGLIVFALVGVLLIFLARRLIEKYRREILWVDSGFVRALQMQVSWPITILASILLISTVILGFILSSNSTIDDQTFLAMVVSAVGIGTGIIFYGIGHEIQLNRYKWVGGIGSLASVLIIFLPSSISGAWLFLGIQWMVIMSISGTWALIQTLQAIKVNRSG